MPFPQKIHLDTTKATPSSILTPKTEPASHETNGSLDPAPSESVANVISHGAPSAPPADASFSTPATASPKAQEPTHQTHGAVLPSQGPITSVAQLLNRGRPVSKNSVGHYETLADYRAYLESLNLHELHRHAVEEAKIVPIDDRNRLIRRLEGEYTAVAARTPGRKADSIPSPKPYTAEQTAQLEELRRKMLRR